MRRKDVRAATRLGELLKKYRLEAGMTQRDLATHPAVDRSVVAISYYEGGQRIPSEATLSGMARALELDADRHQDLLACVKTPIENTLELKGVIEELEDAFTDQQQPEELKQALAARVRSTIQNWRSLQGKGVQWAVVPAAGWQAMSLDSETTSKLVGRATDEARAAGIESCVVVVRPHQKDLLPQNPRIRRAIQDQTIGLGHAVLSAYNHLPSNEPFAVILPDESVTADCLRSMIKLFHQCKGCVVATRPPEEGDEDDYGLALLDTAPSGEATIRAISEKPKKRPEGDVGTILGRYVLTPDMIRDLLDRQTTRSNEERLELTDLLNAYAKKHLVHAYRYEGPVKSVGPARRQWKKALSDVIGHPLRKKRGTTGAKSRGAQD